jgi:topoisomerase-4 subunit A
MHGNNGSLDADPPAAPRYTESRLSLYSEKLIELINKKTVDFIDNFDGSEQEPVVLPNLLPNLLINGANGIAAGYATNIPPFNPIELLDTVIARIDAPNSRLDTILKILPGPDFPTGGIILNRQGIRDAYETGRGKIAIRAKMELVEKDRKKKIYISEIPYETVKCNIIDQINDLAEKFETLNIIEAHDESDMSGVSICINLRDNANYEFVKNYLCKNTELQISYSFNMIAISDKKPVLFSIFEYLDSFIKHAIEIVTKAVTFDCNKAKQRKEVIEGIIKAISIVDDVILLIKKSAGKADAKKSLIEKMFFTESQAEAILELKLYRLSNTDVVELKKEQEELKANITEYEMILNNEEYRNNYLKTKLREYKKIFNLPRRTMFSDEEANVQIEAIDVVEDRPIFIVVTRDGYLRNIPIKSFNSSEYAMMKFKDGDYPVAQFESNLKNRIICITSKGNFISIPNYKIQQVKFKDMGVHINTLIPIDSNEKIVFVCEHLGVSDNRILTIASKNGYIKRTSLENITVSKTPKTGNIMGFEDEDEVIGCLINNADEEKTICVTSTDGKVLAYPISQVSVIGRSGRGVVMSGDRNITYADITTLDDKDFLQINCNLGSKRIKKDTIKVAKRASKLTPVLTQVKTNPIIVKSAYGVNANDLSYFVFEDFSFSYIKSSDITIGSPDTRVSPIKKEKLVNALLVPKIVADKVQNIDSGKDGEQGGLF